MRWQCVTFARRLLIASVAIGVLAFGVSADDRAAPPVKENSGPRPASEPFEFTRLIAHWAGYADPGYLAFVDDAKPEVAQVGFYGAHFWSLADTAFGSGYPAHLPVRGHRECGDWFARLNAELHRRGVKVVGHMNVKFLVGDPDGPEGPRGFFRFYRDQWDEKLLGPKPVADPVDLLEKDKAGSRSRTRSYSIGGMREYWACLNNPHWRKVLKAWVQLRHRARSGWVHRQLLLPPRLPLRALRERPSANTCASGSPTAELEAAICHHESGCASIRRDRRAGMIRRNRRRCGARCCAFRRSPTRERSTKCSCSSAGR